MDHGQSTGDRCLALTGFDLVVRTELEPGWIRPDAGCTISACIVAQ